MKSILFFSLFILGFSKLLFCQTVPYLIADSAIVYEFGTYNNQILIKNGLKSDDHWFKYSKNKIIAYNYYEKGLKRDSICSHIVSGIKKIGINTDSTSLDKINNTFKYSTKMNILNENNQLGIAKKEYYIKHEFNLVDINLLNIEYFLVRGIKKKDQAREDIINLSLTKGLDSVKLTSFSYFGNRFDIANFFKRFRNIKDLKTDSYINIEFNYLDSLKKIELTKYDPIDFFSNNIINTKIKNYDYDFLRPHRARYLNGNLDYIYNERINFYYNYNDCKEASDEIRILNEYFNYPICYFFANECLESKVFDGNFNRIQQILKKQIDGSFYIYSDSSCVNSYDYFEIENKPRSDSSKLLFEGTVIKGIKQGVWRYRNTLCENMIDYNFDKKPEKYIFPVNGRWEYKYSNGKTAIVGNFKNNKKTGTWFFYFPDETLSCIKYFNNDQPYGIWVWNEICNWEKKYLFNLNPKQKVKYPNGYTGYFNLDGKTIIEFKDGAQVGEIKEGSADYDVILKKHKIKKE